MMQCKIIFPTYIKVYRIFFAGLYIRKKFLPNRLSIALLWSLALLPQTGSCTAIFPYYIIVTQAARRLSSCSWPPITTFLAFPLTSKTRLQTLTGLEVWRPYRGCTACRMTFLGPTAHVRPWAWSLHGQTQAASLMGNVCKHMYSSLKPGKHKNVRKIIVRLFFFTRVSYRKWSGYSTYKNSYTIEYNL